MSSDTTSSSQQYSTFQLSLWAWGVCALAAVFYCYGYFLRITPTTMTTSLMRVYHTNAESLGNLTAFYYYAYTPMQLIVGFLLDKFNVRLLVTGACLICALGSYLFAASDILAIAEFGRLLIGLGSAFAFVGVLKLATLWLPPDRFSFVVGLTTTLGTVGGMTGVILLTDLVNHFGWRATMFGSAFVGTILSFLLFTIVRNRPPQYRSDEHYFDASPADSHETISFKELASEVLRLLKHPIIWTNGLIGCILYLPSTAFAELWGLPYLQNIFDLTRTNATYGISILFLGYAIGAPIAGLLSDLINRRKPILLFSSICTTLCISVLVLFPHSLTIITMYVMLFLFGLSYSGQVLIFSVACDIAPANCAGSAIAITNMLTMLGGLIFQPLIGYLLDYFWHGTMSNGLRVYSHFAYQHAMMVLPITMSFAILLSLSLKETAPKKNGSDSSVDNPAIA